MTKNKKTFQIVKKGKFKRIENNLSKKLNLKDNPVIYPTEGQKKCDEKLSDDCMGVGDVPLPMEKLSWRPGTGCTSCKSGTGFAYDLEGDGIIDDYQYNLDILEL